MSSRCKLLDYTRIRILEVSFDRIGKGVVYAYRLIPMRVTNDVFGHRLDERPEPFFKVEAFIPRNK